MSHDQRRGVWYAIACYSIWGILPIYWHAMQAVPAIEILANRMVWSLLFVALLLTLKHNWGWVGKAVHSRHIMLTFLATALLLSANWYIYIWSVNAGYVVESSLGYFITPLVNLLLGVVFMRERLRSGQWVAVGVAAAGVLFLTVTYGQLPWIALSLASTFGLYGLLKKRARLESMEGLALETSFMFIPALVFLIYSQMAGFGAFGNVDAFTALLLVLTGVITVGPLIWFASAARLIPLSMMGFIQYISPTLQFIIGVTLFHEPFNATKLIGFSIIWVALIIYSAEGMMNRNRVTATVEVA